MKFVNHDFVPSDEETPLSKVMADMQPAAQAAAAKDTTGVYDNLSDRHLHTGTASFLTLLGPNNTRIHDGITMQHYLMMLILVTISFCLPDCFLPLIKE